MRLDSYLQFADELDIDAAGDNFSTELDLNVDADASDGVIAMDVFCLVTTTCVSTDTDETCTVQVLSDSVESATTVVASSGVLAEATLVAGYHFRIGVPTNDRYIRLNFSTSDAYDVSGAISAWLVTQYDRQSNRTGIATLTY